MKKKARLEKLKEMKKSMKDEMMNKMDKSDMQKVTVMSDSKEGLEKGLSKAQEIMKKKFKEGGVGTGEDAKYEDDGMEFGHEAPLEGGYKFQNPGLRKQAKKFAKKK